MQHAVQLLLDEAASVLPKVVSGEPESRIDCELVAGELRRARADRVFARFECEYPTPGSWLEILAYPASEGLAISVWDISDRKLAASSLVESEARYRDLFENAPIGYQELDLEGRFTRVNRTQLNMLGYTAEEVLGRHIWDFEWAHGEDPAETRRKFFEKIVSGRLPPTFERVRVRKDGTLLPVLVEDRFIQDASGRITGLRSTMLDITQRKQAEAARVRLAAIVESSDDAIIGKTPGGIVTNWNPAAEQLYGYAADEMIGRPIAQVIPPDRLDEYRCVMERVGRGERVPAFDTVRLRRDGCPVEVSVSLAPITDGSGAVLGVSSTARDISERRTVERLQQEFLAMVTHELRNPIAGVKGYGQLLRRRGEFNERAVETILDQAGVLERLVNELLDASTVQVGQLQLQRGRTDLVAEARACAEQAQHLTLAHEIRVVAPDRPLEGWWDRARLGQVFSNLLSNAIKYSPDGGEVLVTFEDLGPEAQVSVRDQGRGIASDKLTLLFGRFYRADDFQASRSLGLGLYITQGIVASHGGRIRAESDGQGRGSTFSFTLPYGEPPT